MSFGRERLAAVHVVQRAVLELADDRRRQQRQRLAVGLGLQERDDGELADVVGALADHRLEAFEHRGRPAEIELMSGDDTLPAFSAAVSG